MAINPETLLNRARLLLEQGRTNDAIRELKQVLQEDPENSEALAVYARCLYDKNELDQGIEVNLRAIRLDPENSFYFYLLAFGHYRKDQHTAAIDNLGKAISLNPYNAEYYGLLAFVQLEEKKFQVALNKANEGLALDAENITCLNARSTALNKLKRTDAAIETMQDALAQDPDNEFTHATVGWNFLEKGRHKEATKHFREALRIDPNLASARAGLKEALKSKIPPYRWLLQYSFWIHNQGKNASWIIPIGIYLTVRVLASALNANSSTASMGTVLVGAYLVFVVTTWIISPLANFFLLFHPDGKYALTNTERWSAITVVSSLLLGLIFLTPAMSETSKLGVYSPSMIAAFVFLLMAVPLRDVEFPIRFKNTALSNKIALGLVGMGLITIGLGFVNMEAAIFTGTIFAVVFILNNWLGVFR